jgi:hypothetical protein
VACKCYFYKVQGDSHKITQVWAGVHLLSIKCEGFFRKIAELPGWILAINARSNAHDLTVMWHNGRAKISPLLGLVKIYREEAPVCVSVSWSFKQYIYIYIERETLYMLVSAGQLLTLLTLDLVISFTLIVLLNSKTNSIQK